jgi:hypothetical protein
VAGYLKIGILEQYKLLKFPTPNGISLSKEEHQVLIEIWSSNFLPRNLTHSFVGVDSFEVNLN